MSEPNCKLCGGEEWVCEVHNDKAWGGGEGDCGDGKPCGGAGQPCVCNPLHPAHPDHVKTSGELSG
jgi:hypothetical protein